MAYINTITKAYPLEEYQIRLENPNTSFPTPFVAPDFYKVVTPKTIPDYDTSTQGVRELAPKNVRGTYYQQWEIYDLEANLVANIRLESDKAKKEKFLVDIQNFLDATAQTRGYDSILSACTYATSTVDKFKREGQACVEWRDQVWSFCYAYFDEIQVGTKAVPTSTDEFITQLPSINWGDEV